MQSHFDWMNLKDMQRKGEFFYVNGAADDDDVDESETHNNWILDKKCVVCHKHKLIASSFAHF